MDDKAGYWQRGDSSLRNYLGGVFAFLQVQDGDVDDDDEGDYEGGRG